MPQLTVYYRPYCHLCHDLIHRLKTLVGDACPIRTIDIDTDPALEARFGEWVPVLIDHNDNEICHYFLDEAKLADYLNKIR